MMVLVELLASVTVSTLVLVAVASVAIIGRTRLVQFGRNPRSRLRRAVPSLALLVGVLAINGVIRRIGTEISWMIGWNITYDIYAIEGSFVATLQSFSHPWLTGAFSLLYVYGYVFLLVFPIVAYLALDEDTWLRTAALAYSLNYLIGLVCYLLFIAYGPRNLLPDLVEPLLYANWPTSQFLTSQVNTNTNVFPSLHTSLSVTIVLLASRTRHIYPRWLPVAALVGTGVVISTMYLGIHWGIDVLAGIALGVGCVLLAERMVAREILSGWWRAVSTRARETAAVIRNRN